MILATKKKFLGHRQIKVQWAKYPKGPRKAKVSWKHNRRGEQPCKWEWRCNHNKSTTRGMWRPNHQSTEAKLNEEFIQLNRTTKVI